MPASAKSVGDVKSVSTVMKARTDCEGCVKSWVLISPPPYWKVAALITAMRAALDADAAPRRRDELVADCAAVSPVTLIGSGTSVVVAASS